MNIHKSILRALIVVLMLDLTLTGPAKANVAATNPVNPDQGQEPGPALASSPVMFIENIGQFAEGARFQVRGGDRTIWLAEDGIRVKVLEKPSPTQPSSRHLGEEGGIVPFPRFEREIQGKGQGVSVKLSFVGANPHTVIEPCDPLETSVNYFIGNDPAGWQTDVPVYAEVHYKDLYPGVNLELTGAAGYWVWRMVCGGADCQSRLRDVRLRVEGAETVELLRSPNGGERLLLTTAVGEFTLPLLQAVAADGSPLPQAGKAPGVRGNEVTAPFSSAPLLSDPSASLLPSSSAQDQDLLYATFLGGSERDRYYGITVDGSGYAYVTGWTDFPDFPATAGAYDTTHNGGHDAFVAKLSPDGTALAYATFLGGSDWDEGRGIAVDPSGYAYVTGYTISSDFPATPAAYDTTYKGRDAFVAKLSPDGSALAYATFLGGSSGDHGHSIAVDGSGYAYVTGYTISSDFPTTPGAYDTTHNGGLDAFVVKLSPDGSTLAYATYLGGNHDDLRVDLAVDGSGFAYITGYTYSSDFPTTAGAYDTIDNLGSDAFVAKLSPDGSALAYATYLGGSSADYGNGIAVDGSGFAYVTGWTISSDFPTTPAGYDTSYNGGIDAFVAKLSPDGTALAYATFLGGSEGDWGYGIAVDESSHAYVAGDTKSSDFPTTPGAFDAAYNGYGDVFAAKVRTIEYTISGRISDSSNAGINDVTVSTGGGHRVTTDVKGTYTVTLPSGTYELRPSKMGYAFAPDALTVELDSDQPGANFRGVSVACAAPLSEPFLQFPLTDYRTQRSFALAAGNARDGGAFTSWFDHNTPTYTPPNSRIQLFTGQLYTTPQGIEVWGGLHCWGGYCYDGHDGYDIVRPNDESVNPNIYAAGDGTVVAVCSSGGSACRDMTCGALGKHVWVDHGNNYATLYAHLHTVSVNEGTPVTVDTVLGTMGCTGNSTGAHLHFGVYFNWNLRDPWITSTASARQDEVIDPFGWDGLERGISDPWDTPSVNLWRHAPRIASPIGTSGGQLVSPSGRLVAEIPAGAFSEPTLLSLRESPQSAPSATMRSTGLSFSLQALWDWIAGSSTVQAQSSNDSLAEPITVTASYDDAALTHLDVDQLTLHRWDEVAASWQPVDTVLDAVARTATAPTDALGAFDLQAPLICAEDVLEPNDHYATASQLLVGEPIRTLFDVPADNDWFRFDATEGTTYALETSELATGVSTILEVYDTNAATLLAQDGDAGNGSASRLLWTAPDSRSFYVRVRPAATSVTGCDAHYTLSPEVHAADPEYGIYLPLVLRGH